jgi:hypothetical protein
VSRDSSVGIATGYELKGRRTGVQFPAGPRDSALLQSVQTGSEANPVSYTMGNGVISLRVMRQRRESDHTPPSSAVVKNGRAIPSLPISLHDMVLNYLSTGTTFTFTFPLPSVGSLRVSIWFHVSSFA